MIIDYRLSRKLCEVSTNSGLILDLSVFPVPCVYPIPLIEILKRCGLMNAIKIYVTYLFHRLILVR